MYMRHQIRSDFCVLRRLEIFSYQDHELELQQGQLSSEITASKSAIVHVVCVIIMYTIYKMYKDVVSPRSSYAIFLECKGS